MTKKIVAASIWGLLVLPALAQGQQVVHTLKGHEGWVGAVAFSPDNALLATASADRTVRLWDVATGKEQAVLRGHGDAVASVAFAPSGKLLATGSHDRTIKLWQLPGGKELLTLEGHKGLVTAVAFASDSKTLASGSVDGTVILWDVDAARKQVVLRQHTSWVNAVAFAPDGKVGSGSSDATAAVWSRQKQKWKLHALTDAREGEIRSIAFSPDSRLLAVGVRYGIIKVWDIVKGKPAAVLRGHPGDVWAVAFSPDGTTLAGGAGDWDQPGEVRLWDTAKWKSRTTLRHTGEVLCVAFSGDGRLLAAGSWDRTVRLWRLKDSLTPGPQ